MKSIAVAVLGALALVGCVDESELGPDDLDLDTERSCSGRCTPVASSGTRTATISSEYETDVYQFTAAVGSTFTAEVNRLGTTRGLDLAMCVQEADYAHGFKVCDSDSGWGVFPLIAPVVLQSSTPGAITADYWIVVGGETGREIGTYSLTWSTTP